MLTGGHLKAFKQTSSMIRFVFWKTALEAGWRVRDNREHETDISNGTQVMKLNEDICHGIIAGERSQTKRAEFTDFGDRDTHGGVKEKGRVKLLLGFQFV